MAMISYFNMIINIIIVIDPAFGRVFKIFIVFFIHHKFFVNPIQDGLFRGCSWVGRGGAKRLALPKICHTYPTMMKLGTVIPYPKKIQTIYQTRENTLSSADIRIFLLEISKFYYIKK